MNKENIGFFLLGIGIIALCFTNSPKIGLISFIFGLGLMGWHWGEKRRALNG